MSQRPKVAVVGAGMVGASIALGLALRQFDVSLYEYSQNSPQLPQQHPHVRVSAFSHASIQWLQQIGAWQYVEQQRLRDYRFLETWESGSELVQFDAHKIQLERLGVMAENNNIQQALWKALQGQGVIIEQGVGVSHCAVNSSDPQKSFVLTNGETLSADLIVAADGGNSKVRQLSHIPTTGWNYAQHCLIITVEMLEQNERAMATTWQRFTPSGPRAFLPLYNNFASLVWYDSPARVRELARQSLPRLQQSIEQSFPERLGRFKVVECASFPLTRNHADTYFTDNVVLAGDAAHTINPLAGQGVNIGFKDASALVAHLASSETHLSLNLKSYEHERRSANLLMSGAMDVFYAGFSNDNPLLKPLRNAALFAASRSGVFKDKVLKYAIGMS